MNDQEDPGSQEPQALARVIHPDEPATYEVSVVRPAVSPEEAVELWNDYQKLKQAIAEPTDIQVYTEGGKEKRFYKKSYWRKAATFFNLSVTEVEGTERVVKLPDGRFAVTVKYLAAHPGGRTATGDGHCGTDERGKSASTYMQIAGISHTRAYNRAVSNLVGGGEVSAEEVDWAEGGAGGAGSPPVRHDTGKSSGQTSSQKNTGSLPSPSTVKLGFASCKGMLVKDIDDDSLDWYIKAITENVGNPKKARFREQNQELLAVLEFEDRARRGLRPVQAVVPEERYPVAEEPEQPVPFGDMKQWLETAAKAREFLGDDQYYTVLGSHGFSHANEAQSMKEWIALYRALELVAQLNRIKGKANGGSDADTVPEVEG